MNGRLKVPRSAPTGRRQGRGQSSDTTLPAPTNRPKFGRFMQNRFPRLGLVALMALSLAASMAGAASDGMPGLVPLTDEELAWISAHPVVRVGHDATFSPYAIQDAAGNIVGIDPDYLELIARRTGLQFQNEAGRDWGQVLENFKAGRVDLLLSLNRAAERESFLIYTNSYASAYNVIITRTDEPYPAALADLQGHTIGIPRGAFGVHGDFEAGLARNMLVEYEKPLECYQAVARGDVYASIGEVASANYFIKAHRLTNLRFGGVVSASSELYLGVRKDWPLLAQIINKALATMTATDRQRITNRWIAADVSSGQRWARAFKIAAAIAAGAVGVFLLVLWHNRRLARELAERRRIQVELERTRDRLQQAGREKNELLHMVAHDLRSPLTAILLGLDLLQHDPPLPAATLTRTAKSIDKSAALMARLINDLLSTQNLEEGRRSLKFYTDDAARIARTAVAAMYNVAQHKQITVEPLLPEGAVGLTTDFVALQQVVDNLLSNAIKYSPPGARVEIEVTADATHCRFAVRDQGPGVKEEEREKIFEKFSRGSAQPTLGEESTGLGLWIVRRFVHSLYGRVWCEPGPGNVGTVFVVEVPLTPPAA
jgi:signal transduction histidine kinase